MQIGRVGPVPDEIKDLGFLITDKIHILGMDIDANISELDENFAKTIVGLKKSVDYWKRYNLSLPGRINVIKSLLFFSNLVPRFLSYAKSGENQIHAKNP
jgi:hypothetical protein